MWSGFGWAWGGDTSMRKGCWLWARMRSAGCARTRKPRFATPGVRPGLPKCQPSLGTGPIHHPLPDLSGEDAAKIARLLADERADLEARSPRGIPDQPDRASKLPASVPHSLLPAPRRASQLAGTFPWKDPVAEPSWHVLGAMVGLRPDKEGGFLRLVPLAEPAADTPPSDAAEVPPDEAVEASAEPPDPAVASVRDTFAIVGAAGDEAIGYFYGWLFARHPELRALFPTAMNEQRDRLFRALSRIVSSLSSPEAYQAASSLMVASAEKRA
jgi:hypothetical protein